MAVSFTSEGTRSSFAKSVFGCNLLSSFPRRLFCLVWIVYLRDSSYLRYDGSPGCTLHYVDPLLDPSVDACLVWKMTEWSMVCLNNYRVESLEIVFPLR